MAISGCIRSTLERARGSRTIRVPHWDERPHPDSPALTGICDPVGEGTSGPTLALRPAGIYDCGGGDSALQ
jgi:hypothetical protein